MSSLQAISGFKFELDLVQRIIKDYSALSKSGKTIVLCRIPGHVGISGNEKADTALCLRVTPWKSQLPNLFHCSIRCPPVIHSRQRLMNSIFSTCGTPNCTRGGRPYNPFNSRYSTPFLGVGVCHYPHRTSVASDADNTASGGGCSDCWSHNRRIGRTGANDFLPSVWFSRCSTSVVVSWLAVWCSGNALVSINAVALHRAWLVLGWVTTFGQVNCLIT